MYVAARLKRLTIMLFTVGFTKRKGFCKEYATKLPDLSLIQCAEHCAKMANCRDISTVNNECWINIKTCYQGVQQNAKGEAYSKVLFKGRIRTSFKMRVEYCGNYKISF